MSTIRVGIVGAGFMGSVHAASWAGCADAEVTAVTSGGSSTPDELARQHGATACPTLDDLLGLVDVVDVCTPTDSHHDIVLAAAAAGRAVVCEKPLARTAEQGEKMVAFCRDAGVPLLVGHVVRFFPEYASAKNAIDNGDVGDPGVVRLTRATFQPSRAAGNWYVDHERSGGLVLDLMIHDFDYARWVSGDVRTVYARSVRTARPESGTDHVLAILRHESGALTHVEGSWAHPPPTFRTRGEISGTHGFLEFDSARDAPVRPVLRAGSRSGGDVTLPSSPLAVSPHTIQLRHFADVLRGTAEPIIAPDDALSALRIAVAVAESIEIGRPVEVEAAS